MSKIKGKVVKVKHNAPLNSLQNTPTSNGRPIEALVLPKNTSIVPTKPLTSSPPTPSLPLSLVKPFSPSPQQKLIATHFLSPLDGELTPQSISESTGINIQTVRETLTNKDFLLYLATSESGLIIKCRLAALQVLFGKIVVEGDMKAIDKILAWLPISPETLSSTLLTSPTSTDGVGGLGGDGQGEDVMRMLMERGGKASRVEREVEEILEVDGG